VIFRNNLLSLADPFDRETVFFRMRNSELLNFYVGHPVTLYLMPDRNSATIEKTILGPDPEQGHNYFVALPRDR
jgi:predicted cupin superfamily sugar epimerase